MTMMRTERILKPLILLGILITLFLTGPARGQTSEQFIHRVENATLRVAARSFPEIDRGKIRFRLFESRSNFFKARFSIGRFLTLRPMRHILYLNPEARVIPDDALEGVLAHELSHILSYTGKNRFELLGLVCIVSQGFASRFERKADLVAIERGYGPALHSFRQWLYSNVNGRDLAAKKRDYFTPEEIELLLVEAVGHPAVMKAVKDAVPKDINELREIVRIAEK